LSAGVRLVIVLLLLPLIPLVFVAGLVWLILGVVMFDGWQADRELEADREAAEWAAAFRHAEELRALELLVAQRQAAAWVEQAGPVRTEPPVVEPVRGRLSSVSIAG
jgi:hypothetical protein